jgi:hypothetical protein
MLPASLIQFYQTTANLPSFKGILKKLWIYQKFHSDGLGLEHRCGHGILGCGLKMLAATADRNLSILL